MEEYCDVPDPLGRVSDPGVMERYKQGGQKRQVGTGFSSLQLFTEHPKFLPRAIVYLALYFPTFFILPSVVTTYIIGSVNNHTFEKCVSSMKLLGECFPLFLKGEETMCY